MQKMHSAESLPSNLQGNENNSVEENHLKSMHLKNQNTNLNNNY